ncbi:short-chain dehydrogenase/reductase SDR [Heliocybe sulcata]|uniref:Short-chain dehydrogenase/reductase SDR n=1 Tax=Heliocybe sulcata TaxID=5364 RepID=A0A5C3MRA5_9AGAM|nr:short-chain dehydrogenase/reductase SDR [Heliocybe sulcata]
MAERLTQISGHLTNSYSRGLLAGEVAIVTGAGQGIGRAISLLFAKEGAKVVVADLEGDKAQAVVDEIKKAGGDGLAFGGDVGTHDFPKRIIDATIQKFGKINHIINNAGFTYDRMLHTTADDAWDAIMRIHVRAPFRLVREAAPHMRIKDPKARENRCVINVSSLAGLHGNVGQANYSTAKAGVIGLTKTIAREWGSFGVRANTVAFGYVKTRLTQAREDGAVIEIDGKKVELGIPGLKERAAKSFSSNIPLGRGAEPEEAAGAVLLLVSPLASYVTGTTLEVTGGEGI